MAVNEDQLNAAPLAMKRIELLRGLDQLVAALGGDSAGLLGAARIHPTLLRDRHALVPFAAAARLFERAAQALTCPEFGMRLAAMQRRGATSGPLFVAMRH